MYNQKHDANNKLPQTSEEVKKQMQKEKALRDKLDKYTQQLQSAAQKASAEYAKQKAENKAHKGHNELIEKYCNAINSNQDATDALKQLSLAVAYAVVNKCINVGCTDMHKLHQNITKGKQSLSANTIANSAYITDDDYNLVTVNKTLSDNVFLLILQSIGDGYDLVHTATVAILEEVKKQQIGKVDLERPYKARVVKRKIRIKGKDAEGEEKTEIVEIKPIQNVYRAVRREIEKARSVKDTSLYTYLQSDEESQADALDRIYFRLQKYADLGGYAHDANGKDTVYTVDNDTADTVYTLLEQLNLTARQATVIKLRLAGYGKKAIATRIGINPDSVRNILRQIQIKARNCPVINTDNL